jgi:hypothetical protein
VMLLLFAAILAPVVVFSLVLFVLLLVIRTNNRLIAVQRQQDEEFAQLRRAIAELRPPPVGTPPGDRENALPRIGSPERILQIGDYVVITDGPNGGEHGTIIPSPDWLREGMACVDLAGGRGPRYVEVSKLARLDEGGGE